MGHSQGKLVCVVLMAKELKPEIPERPSIHRSIEPHISLVQLVVVPLPVCKVFGTRALFLSAFIQKWTLCDMDFIVI